MKAYDFKKGALLLVDKPKDWTSFDVVNKIRFTLRKALGLRKIKVGHSGTLDPMATGLLVICTGKFTKKLQNLTGLDKEYTGTITLGATTPSYDMETEIDEHFPVDHLNEERIKAAVPGFIGKQEQLPPIFSAIKVDGQPAYKKARAGKEIKLQAREIFIHEFELSRIEIPEVDFRLHCSKGSYVRSLAYDFGKAVDSGAYLSKLRRTRIGDYSLEDAWNLEDLVEGVRSGELIQQEEE